MHEKYMRLPPKSKKKGNHGEDHVIDAAMYALSNTQYHSENHIGVITQMHGSLWPKVLPYCLINVALSAVLQLLKGYDIVDLSITDKGHLLMTMFLAFLIMSRVNMSLVARYKEDRGNLGIMYREAREIIYQGRSKSRSERMAP
jgi:predicted membrane chloride channel (bestrophin family)